MKNTTMTLTAVAVALSLTACANDQSSPVKTQEKVVAAADGSAAGKIMASIITATVSAIDQKTRHVSLVGPKGNVMVIQAGEQVRNLSQVKVGDKVTVEYYEGLVADLNANPSAQAQSQVVLTEALQTAALGNRPAGAAASALRQTVKIEFIDTAANVVQFKGPDGVSHVVKVMKPEFQAMLKKVKVGDAVELTFFEALAISVNPAAH